MGRCSVTLQGDEEREDRPAQTTALRGPHVHWVELRVPHRNQSNHEAGEDDGNLCAAGGARSRSGLEALDERTGVSLRLNRIRIVSRVTSPAAAYARLLQHRDSSASRLRTSAGQTKRGASSEDNTAHDDRNKTVESKSTRRTEEVRHDRLRRPITACCFIYIPHRYSSLCLIHVRYFFKTGMRCMNSHMRPRTSR